MSNTIKLKRGSGSDPGSSALSVGEVALRTDNGKLFTKKDDGSVVQIGGGAGAIDDGAITNAKVASDAAIAGSKISPDFGSQNIVTTGTLGSGNLTIQNTYPSLFLFDTDHNDDFSIQNQNGLFAVRDETNSANRFTIGSDGTVDVVGNLDVGAGLDVTGNIVATGALDVVGITIGGNTPSLNFTDANDNPDFRFLVNSNSFILEDTTNSANRLVVNSDGHIDIAGNVDFGAGIDVTGNVNATGNLAIQSANPKIYLTDTDNNSDYIVQNNNGAFRIYDDTNSSQRFVIGADGQAFFTQLLNAQSGLEVTGEITATSHIDLPDSARIKLGTGDDLEIHHNGTNSVIDNNTGDLFIETTGSGDDIYIKSNDDIFLQAAAGEDGIKIIGDGAVELYHNNSKKFETTAAGGQFTGTEIKGPDNCKFVAGTSGDADFYHDGSATYLRNATGNLHIRSDNTIELQPYSGDEVYAKFINDGAVELYYDGTKKLDTRSSGVGISGNLFFVDSDRIYMGDSNDFQLFHDGSNTNIVNSTGTLTYRSDTHHFKDKDNSDTHAKFVHDGAVELYYDNSKKFETSSSGATVTGTLSAEAANLGTGDLTLTGNINLADSTGGGNNRIVFGASDDFQLWHDGSHSYIADEGTGNLRVLTNSFTVNNTANSANLAQFTEGGSVELYHNGTKRFETTSGGATLTGSLTVSGTVDGRDVASDGSKLDGIASGATNVTNNNQLTNGAGYITSVSGQNYNSLSNLPTIPSNNNQLSNGAGYITSVSGQNYNSLSNLPTIPSNNNQLSNGAGYITSGSNRAAQAYVNFTGDGTPSIRDDVNVSSISDNGTGLYTVNFSSSMPNSSYCVSTGFANSGNSNVCKVVEDSLSTGSFQLRCGSYQDGSGNTNRDFHSVYCSIFAG